MRKAFTLVEVMVVLVIIGIIVAIATPPMVKAKEKAQITSSLMRLRQLHIAVELYRGEYDLHDDFNVRHFPPFNYVYDTYLGFDEDFFRSPCGYKEGIEANLKRISYQYYPYPFDLPNDPSTRYYQKYGPNAMLFRDPHCNQPEDWHATMLPKRGLGVTVGGQLLNFVKRGDPSRNEWWTEP